MNYISFIARRYLFVKSHNNAINVIVKVASLGVFFASAAFIIVLSAFSGIRTFNLDLMKLSDPDIVIKAKKGKTFTLNTVMINALNKEKEIAYFSKVLEEKVFINFENKQKIAKIKGVDSNYYRVIPLDTTIIMGRTPSNNTPEFMVGVSIANELSLMPGAMKFVNIMVPKPGKGMVTDPRKAFYSKDFLPVGVYETTADHDGLFLYSSLATVQDLLHHAPNSISQIELKIKHVAQIEEVRSSLQQKFGAKFFIQDRQRQNPLIYKMLNTENLMTYFVLSLILFLALFNIVGSIMMIVIDKRKDIATLNQFGIDFHDIKKIFFVQGFSMTMISGLAGLLLGLLIIYIQITKTIFYIGNSSLPFPAEIRITNIFWVLITLVFMGVFSTLIAVKRIKR